MTVHAAAFDSSPQIRPPPTAVKLLLPVWGYRYINQFLEFCLPTLLAPGNIPALVAALPCEFHLMTSAADVPIIADHPAWQKLQSVCRVKIELIDDLITDGNHSTTITLAYSRAVRAAGPQMVDTCFINICADYLFSEKALENVLKRVNAGASAVLAGNFQIVSEEGLTALRRKIDPTRVELIISSRELIKIGLTYLHPATVANIINFGLFHNEHTNRLFWRVDDSTLIGRFYLLHVVCIRPEVMDFVTGSSFDYSFVPELCPSNNVAIFTDSDDYFVLELQTRNHEANQLRPGPLEVADLAISLSEWTTARHRENAQSTLVFHAEDIPSAVVDATAKADAFINQVTAALTSEPLPHRNHPYWTGAIFAHRRATGQPEVSDDMEGELGRGSEPPSGTLAFLWRLRMRFYGIFPELGACHPYWPDFRAPLERLERLLAENKRALIVSPTPNAFTPWLAKRSPASVKMECSRLLNMTDLQYKGLFGRFDACFVHLTEREVKLGDVFIDRVAPLLKPDGVLLFVVCNNRIDDIAEFKQSFAYHSVRFGNFALWLTDIHYVSTSNWRSFVQKKIVDLGRLAQRQPAIGLPVAAAFGPPLLIASYLCNRSAALGLPMPPVQGYCSSVFMEMRASGRTQSGWRPRFGIDRETIRPSDGANVSPKILSTAGSGGKLLQQVKASDSLLSSLARYKFAARMLAGKENVCQIGYDQAAGPALVRSAVTALIIYVDRTEVPANTFQKYEIDSTIQMEFHEISRERLPASYDAIYSFDALEGIAPENEQDFLQHIGESLSRDSDVVIMGCPARISEDAGKKIGGQYPRRGIQLRSLMLRYFDTVLMFSMIEDQIEAGVLSSADYFIAVVCGRHK
jgi:hypothetical protein